jgi:hypothetical protein
VPQINYKALPQKDQADDNDLSPEIAQADVPRDLWNRLHGTPAQKQRTLTTARYMADTLKGVLPPTAPPPADWTDEQRAIWQRVLSDPALRATALAWASEGGVA